MLNSVQNERVMAHHDIWKGVLVVYFRINLLTSMWTHNLLYIKSSPLLANNDDIGCNAQMQTKGIESSPKYFPFSWAKSYLQSI